MLTDQEPSPGAEAGPASLPPSLTADGFLGGRLKVLQPEKGYRAGIDGNTSIVARKETKQRRRHDNDFYSGHPRVIPKMVRGLTRALSVPGNVLTSYGFQEVNKPN